MTTFFVSFGKDRRPDGRACDKSKQRGCGLHFFVSVKRLATNGRPVIFAHVFMCNYSDSICASSDLINIETVREGEIPKSNL